MYYPKHQIVEDLHTNGGEFKPINSNENYTGSYYATSDNEYYTGKNPEDGPNVRLILLSPGTSPINNITGSYKNNNTSFIMDPESEPVGEHMYIEDIDYYKARNLEDRGDAPRPPKKSINIPTEKDYNEGVFYRFFVKKGNEGQFIEVSLDEYNLFNNQDSSVDYNLYIPIKIIWNLKGKEEEVYTSNKATVSLLEQRNQLFGFTLFFKGKFSKYWRG
jgi:hypothetical protein